MAVLAEGSLREALLRSLDNWQALLIECTHTYQEGLAMTPEEFVEAMRKISAKQTGNFYEGEALSKVIKNLLRKVDR